MKKRLLEFVRSNVKAIVIVFVLAALFYWFQIRPTYVRAVCEKDTSALNDRTKASGNQATMTQLNFHYSACLHKYGI